MSEAKPLFRKAALDRLTSPDQLDQLIDVTSPLGWLALAALGALCVAALAWACLADLPTRIAGQGILVAQGGGVVDAVTPAPGILSVLRVKPGDKVTRGQIIAELVQPAARATLDHARDAVRDLRAEQQRLDARLTEMLTQRRDSITRQRARLVGVATAAQQRSDFYRQELADVAEPASRNLVTRQRMQDLRQGMQDADQEMLRTRGELAKLETDDLDARSRRDEQLTQSGTRIADAERRLGELEADYAGTSQVAAPADGEVIELKAVEGVYVTVGTPLASIKTGAGALEAALFIAPEQGKKIRPGMRVQIEPATVQREEYGTMTGTVVSVSDFPASARGMQAVLQNDELVRQFSRAGPPYAARVAIATNSVGYVWSSGMAPPITITVGTLVEGDITVRSRHPIALVLPFLNTTLGQTR